MLKNYFLIAFRNARKYKGYTLINMLGLALGLAVCLAILLYVRDEFSYDNFHEKVDRIYLFQQFNNSSGSGGKFASWFSQELGQVENTVRLLPVKALLENEENRNYERDFVFADSSVFDVFTLPLKQGNPDQVLDEPYSLVLSESMARKYFGKTDPVGKTLTYEGEQELRITGVMRDLPPNSHIDIDFLASYNGAEELLKRKLDGYWDNMNYTYLLLEPGTSGDALATQMDAAIERTGDPNAAVWVANLIPLSDLYLKYSLSGKVKAVGAMQYVSIFSIVALFILLLACFNYMNLATARSAQRAEEVGVRKTFGARRSQLAGQFLCESLAMTVIAFLLAIVILQLFLPLFNQLTGKQLAIQNLITTANILGALAFLILVSVLTGLYPAWVLSSFRPIDTLNRIVSRGRSGVRFRQGLVTAQFAISITLIAGTLVVMDQLQYIQKKDLGYSRDQVMILSFEGKEPDEKRILLKEELLRLPGVRTASFCSNLPGLSIGGNKLTADHLPEGADVGVSFMAADENYLQTFGIELAEGKPFSGNRQREAPEFYVNESLLNRYQWESGTNRKLAYYTYRYRPDGGYEEIPVEGEIVGVVEDYHQLSLHEPIYPLVIVRTNNALGNLAVKLRGGSIQSAVQALESRWSAIFPDRPFNHTFLDESFDATYRNDLRTGHVLSLFSVLAILISCLGLFGLAAFTAERRTKEIGIRKVLGASVKGLVGLLVRDFLKLVLLAFIIGVPVAWYLMNRWLEDFAYRVELTWWIFAMAGALTLGIAFLTVVFQSLRAARANPVKALRTE